MEVALSGNRNEGLVDPDIVGSNDVDGKGLVDGIADLILNTSTIVPSRANVLPPSIPEKQQGNSPSPPGEVTMSSIIPFIFRATSTNCMSDNSEGGEVGVLPLSCKNRFSVVLG